MKYDYAYWREYLTSINSSLFEDKTDDELKQFLEIINGDNSTSMEEIAINLFGN